MEAQDFALPPDLPGETTVGAFLDAVTAVCVAQYEKRRQEGDLLRLLTAEEIADKAASGKVSFGAHYGNTAPDLARAQENTRQCYLDGMFALFVDGKAISSLDASLPLETSLSLREGNSVTFVRLTMLAGRMW